jgi:hypothetical protein
MSARALSSQPASPAASGRQRARSLRAHGQVRTPEQAQDLASSPFLETRVPHAVHRQPRDWPMPPVAPGQDRRPEDNSGAACVEPTIPDCRPNHVAMILDGNQRWARHRGLLDAYQGHQVILHTAVVCTRRQVKHASVLVPVQPHLRYCDSTSTRRSSLFGVCVDVCVAHICTMCRRA